MDENLKKLLSAFNANHVKYVVIGGYAVFVHAQPRMTKDLDVFIESSPENAAAVCKGLAEFGAPLGQFTVDDFADGKTVGRFAFRRSVSRFCRKLMEWILTPFTPTACPF